MDMTGKELHAMQEALSLEECEYFVKENMLRVIHSYLAAFQGNLRMMLRDMSEEDMREVMLAVKFFCRVQVATEGKVGTESELDKWFRKERSVLVPPVDKPIL